MPAPHVGQSLVAGAIRARRHAAHAIDRFRVGRSDLPAARSRADFASPGAMGTAGPLIAVLLKRPQFRSVTRSCHNPLCFQDFGFHSKRTVRALDLIRFCARLTSFI